MTWNSAKARQIAGDRVPPAGPRRVVFVVYPAVKLLDLTGPLQVFNDTPGPTSGVPAYEVVVASLVGGAIPTDTALAIPTVRLESLGRKTVDSLIVVGGVGVQEALREPALVRAITRLHRRSRRTASVCSGAFLLAEAGLLAGRRAVTHWGACQDAGRGLSRGCRRGGSHLHQRRSDLDLGRCDCRHRLGPGYGCRGSWAPGGAGGGAASGGIHGAARRTVSVQRGAGPPAGGFRKPIRRAAPLDRAKSRWRLARGGLGRADSHEPPQLRPALPGPQRRNTGQGGGAAAHRGGAGAFGKQRSCPSPTIAQRCGFGDDERMRCAFRRQLRVAPSDYRQTLSNLEHPASNLTRIRCSKH